MFDFKNLKDIAGMMGNREELQQKFQQMQQELARKTAEGEAGGGAVRVTVNGQFQVQQVRIDPTMLGALTGEGDDTDREMVEELIAAATNAAMEKAQHLIQSQMSDFAGGMNIPGLDQLLGGGSTGPDDQSEDKNTGNT